MKEKKILFLSGLDFKEKSIQVIKKTPEAYVNKGWDVYYIVARDTSKYGNYFYEEIVNPKGVKVVRFSWPFRNLLDRIKNKTLRTIINKIAGYIVILKLAYYGYKMAKKENIDIIYGYEVHGVLAAHLIKLFKVGKNKKYVHRFQGTFFYKFLEQKKYLKILLNWEHLLSLKLNCDLLIMTDDGTQGDKVIKKLNPAIVNKMRFWPNGVDEIKLPSEEIEKLKIKYNINNNEIVFLTVCRLESWKRVDRALNTLSILKNKYKIHNFKYFIVGDGTEKKSLEQLTKNLSLNDNVIFVGAIKNEQVKEFYNLADIFISTYDYSNVGNPLLEAIRANKIIFTLDNGDTRKWIKHYQNGFIYPIDEFLYEKMAKDIYKVINDIDLRDKIIENIRITEKEMLWTWEERLNNEVEEVEKLVK